MENVVLFINTNGPAAMAAVKMIPRLISVIFFLYGFSLLAEGTNTLRTAAHPLAPSVSQATSILAIGYLLLSALLWAVGS